MPANNKPSVDWSDIRRRYQDGETAYAISKSLEGTPGQVSKQGIMKRAKREDWDGTQQATKKWLSATEKLPSVARMQNPETHQEKLLAAYGNRTPETLAEILRVVETGIAKTIAARMAGISEDTLRQWEKDDPEVTALIRRAEQQRVVGWADEVNKAAERGDWKAAVKMLESHPETKEQFAPKHGVQGGTNIQVVLNIPRGEPVEGIIIDG